MKIEEVKVKIAKLLALAGNNSNENEVRAALLKARKLMAEYKLHPDEIEKSANDVGRMHLGITCTKMTDCWLPSLCTTIASHFRCVAYRDSFYRSKRSEMFLVGLDDDLAICVQIIYFAYDYVIKRCNEIRKEMKSENRPARSIREACNAYGFGFNYGMKVAYDAQDSAHQELGLVLTVPQQVRDATSDLIGKTYVNIQMDGWRREFVIQGYTDGKNFNPYKKLKR